MKTVFVSALIFIVSLFTSSCTDQYKTISDQLIVVDKSDLKEDTLIEDTVTHRYFSRIKNGGGFGRVFKLQLKKDEIGGEFYVVVKGKIRSNYAQSNSTISFSTADRDNRQIDWLVVFLKTHYTSINEWSYFNDSVRVEHNQAGRKATSISCFVFLPYGTNEHFDVDTLRMAVKQKM